MAFVPEWPARAAASQPQHRKHHSGTEHGTMGSLGSRCSRGSCQLEQCRERGHCTAQHSAVQTRGAVRRRLRRVRRSSLSTASRAVMRLMSVLRRMWSTSSSSSSSPRRRRRAPPRSGGGGGGGSAAAADARMQERTVIAAYRMHVSRLADTLSARWRRFDVEPGDHALLHQIRGERAALTQAIEAYYAALGRRDTGEVIREVRIAENCDVRLATIEQEVLAEVQRFSSAAIAVNARFSAAANPAERLDVCADANDLLVELELYRDGWLQLMDQATRERLHTASTMLRNIVDVAPSHSPQRAQSPHTRRSPQSLRTSRQDPMYVVSRPGRLPISPVQHAPIMPSDSPSSSVLFYPGPNPPPIPSAKRMNSDVARVQYTQGDAAASGMMISRSRTLRDMAENALKASKSDAADIEDANDTPSRSQQNGPMEQPALRASKNMSFASALYQTYNRRVDSISDAGLRLSRSEVRGDGRCLFRSLVRCRYHARETPLPSEPVEREEADRLRMRTVAELKNHRELLVRFYVIEGNFTQYTRRMSNPKTYGGEPELLMLAKLLHVPIAVHIRRGRKFRQIQVYGKQYRGDPLRILYSDGIHYDALLAIK
eukprot:TRINITY_DN876_c0_g2_i1.p1 TRINITY_DN876_c0_g2~~TRINITY_DN876_c0_g2_i1.p1  ORF type:complete len:602 (+),score=93.71 TRINITY_DN876_c0_g2_i1:4553-6358(+)